MRLSPEEREAVERYAARLVPPGRADANWRALVRRLDRGEAPIDVDEPEPAPEAAAPRWRRAWWVAGAAAALLLASASAALYPRSAAEREPAAPLMGAVDLAEALEERPWSRREAVRDRLSIAMPPEVQTSEPEARRRATTHHGRVVPSRERSPASVEIQSTWVTSIAAETRLIGAARAALRDRRPKHALVLLDRHARAFTRGHMETERRALRVRALCMAGATDQAERERERFVSDFPHSPLLATLSCAP